MGSPRVVKVVAQLADVRILALGVQHEPGKSFQVNPNAGLLLCQPDLSLPRVQHPTLSHTEYPNYTPGGHNTPWVTTGGLKAGSRVWVGSLMSAYSCVSRLSRSPNVIHRLVAQLINPALVKPDEEDFELVVGAGHYQYSSFTWSDLWAIAPWMANKVTRRIEGPGLGID